MKKPDSAHVLLAAAFAVLLCGAAWSVATLRQLPAEIRHIDRRLADLDIVRDYARAVDQQLTAAHVFEALPTTRPPDLATLIRQRMSDVRVEVRRRDTFSAWGDWQGVRMEVSFETIALPQLGEVFHVAETQRPPWRLVEGSIVALEQRPDAVRATLIFEGLSK